MLLKIIETKRASKLDIYSLLRDKKGYFRRVRTFKMNLNSHMYSQRGRWEQGLCPVGGDCYHTIINPISKIKSCFFFIPDVGAMAYPKGISVGHRPYGFEIKALVGCSPRLHRFNVCLFGFDGVVRGLHPTDIYFVPILLNGALGNAPYEFLHE